MPLRIMMGDITKMNVCAIVCPTDEDMSGGGGTDLAVHEAAGPGLRRECDAIGRCEIGSPVVTSAYRLPCRYVVHTVGPTWRGGGDGEAAALEACALRALEAAAKAGCRSAALPLISSGTFGFPRPLALATLTGAARRFLDSHDMKVRLVVYDRGDFEIDANVSRRVSGFIDEHFESDDTVDDFAIKELSASMSDGSSGDGSFDVESMPLPMAMPMAVSSEPRARNAPAALSERSLADALASVEMSFRDALLRLIDESGMTDAECYKRANIDRKHFSKIRGNRDYAPSKNTVLSFAIALSLPIAETSELLERAGYALSRSSKRDVIVEYFIRQEHFDIFEINEALFAFGQKPLCT